MFNFHSSQCDIISEIIENPILLESEIDIKSTVNIEINLDEQLNEINSGQRQVKYQSQKNNACDRFHRPTKLVLLYRM